MNLLLLLSLLPLGAFAQNLNEEVAATMALRQEVELLSHEVESLKKAQQGEMDVYIQRHQEVTAQVLKEKFRQDQLKTQIKLGQDKLADHSKRILSKGSAEWLKDFWARYVESLKSAHPLYAGKLQERISRLQVDLAFKKISYEHALLQTWFILESDLNKSQDAEFMLAPLEVGGKLHHVEMVRLGRTKGYFRTANGKYGLLTHHKGWEIRQFEDATSKNEIEILLAQFKQQQKTGLYKLPGIKL